MELNFDVNEKMYTVNVVRKGEDFVVDIGHKSFTVSAMELKPGYMMISTSEKSFKTIVSSEGETRYVFWGGHVYRLNKVERSKAIAGIEPEKLSGNITSPISGKVVKVPAQEGQAVEARQDLMIIEAMKMEYRVKAPFQGTVNKIHFKEGDQVDIGQLLVELKGAEEE